MQCFLILCALSGIVSQIYRVEHIKKPLEIYRDIDAFKIYVSDVGLLCAKKDLMANAVLYMVEELNDFKDRWYIVLLSDGTY